METIDNFGSEFKWSPNDNQKYANETTNQSPRREFKPNEESIKV